MDEASPRVVSANAGTHSHRGLLVRKALVALPEPRGRSVWVPAFAGTTPGNAARAFAGTTLDVLENYGFKIDAPVVTRLSKSMCALAASFSA